MEAVAVRRRPRPGRPAIATVLLILPTILTVFTMGGGPHHAVEVQLGLEHAARAAAEEDAGRAVAERRREAGLGDRLGGGGEGETVGTR